MKDEGLFLTFKHIQNGTNSNHQQDSKYHMCCAKRIVHCNFDAAVMNLYLIFTNATILTPCIFVDTNSLKKNFF